MREDRTTHYGFAKEADMAKKIVKKVTLTPLTDETTVYGAKKFRTPKYSDEFVGTQGSKIPAYVFDIDGTLQTWGSGADKTALAWAKKLYDADPHAVFLVVTARDHGSFGYTSSFNWLMQNFPYPFIGPFARPVDDPRYASEFKRELAQSFEDAGLYQILGAADDNEWVIKMWKQWAIDHFEDPADFDLLECSYGEYGSWRKDLSYKGGRSYTSGGRSYPSYGSYGTSTASDHKGEHWVNGNWDGSTWVTGHWAKDADATPIHRPAGVSRWTSDPAERDLTQVVGWQNYLAKREKAGAYTGVDVTDDLDDVIDVLEADREVLEEIVTRDWEYTPAEVTEMTLEDLRELAGVTAADRRETVLDQVHDWFRGGFGQAELDLCTTAELEALMEMTDADADVWMDKRWDEVYPTGAQEVLRAGKDDARATLEEEVYAEYSDLTYREIEGMATAELELLLASAKKLSGPVGEQLALQIAPPAGEQVA